jgi:hypothetical protein
MFQKKALLGFLESDVFKAGLNWPRPCSPAPQPPPPRTNQALSLSQILRLDIE